MINSEYLEDRQPRQLVVVAAQHPLVEHEFPNVEFESRLTAALWHSKDMQTLGVDTDFFLPGSRHIDEATGEADEVALYDAAGRWLLERGVPSAKLHGKDWIDVFDEDRGVYNGADELRVVANALRSGATSNYESVIMFCSPMQARRAKRHGAAFGISDLAIAVPEVLMSSDIHTFHRGLGAYAMIALTALDPKGKVVYPRISAKRRPQDGSGTKANKMPEYAELPWY